MRSVGGGLIEAEINAADPRRINQCTVTLHCDGQTWRVGFGLLRPLVDI